MKRCSECGIEKPLADFFRCGLGRRWYRSRCKLCYTPIAHRWAKKNPEKARVVSREKARKYIASHREEMRTKVKAWRKRNPEAVRFASNLRRARRNGARVSDLTIAQWAGLKERYNFSCAYCGERVPVLTQDHVLALSRGGNHTQANVVPACLTCNLKKHARPVGEFLAELGKDC